MLNVSGRLTSNRWWEVQRFDVQRFVSEDVWFACVCETWVERSTSRYMEIHLPSERENDFACGASVKRWFNENLYSTPTTRKENHGLACKIHSRVFHIFGTGLMRAFQKCIHVLCSDEVQTANIGHYCSASRQSGRIVWRVCRKVSC